jgi:biopolymer transport protein ExbD
MKFRVTDRRDEPELNLIPFIDIIFILLIFFITTTTFNREAEISIELPVAKAEPSRAQDKVLEIIIDAQGQFYINHQLVVNTEIETLKRAISKAAEGLKDPPVIISADAKTPHQAVVTAMSAAQQVGFVHLTFATKQLQDSK